MSKQLIAVIALVNVFSSCTKDPAIIDNRSTQLSHYLHLSHTRTDANPTMDSLVEKIDYSAFDMLLLGGDLTWYTSENESTINYVDSIFDLQNPNTLWSVGNHDYFDPNLIENSTGRPTYYAYYHKGITFVVLDTQAEVSQITSPQLELLTAVLDTLTQSSHLVVLTHQLIWMYGNSELESQIDEISNGPQGSCDFCVQPNNFYAAVYPRLLEAKNRKIDVICIAGDIGSKVSSFEYLTPEGIYFLASGIKANTSGNMALLFSHQPQSRTLHWEFTPLETLVE